MRYKEISVILNEFDNKVVTLTGEKAIMVQNLLDHIDGIGHSPVAMALVRVGGHIHPRDFCPCGSKKRFINCCGNDTTDTTETNCKEL